MAKADADGKDVFDALYKLHTHCLLHRLRVKYLYLTEAQFERLCRFMPAEFRRRRVVLGYNVKVVDAVREFPHG